MEERSADQQAGLQRTPSRVSMLDDKVFALYQVLHPSKIHLICLVGLLSGAALPEFKQNNNETIESDIRY